MFKIKTGRYYVVKWALFEINLVHRSMTGWSCFGLIALNIWQANLQQIVQLIVQVMFQSGQLWLASKYISNIFKNSF